MKIRATDSNRAEVLKLVELIEGPGASTSRRESVIVEVTGPEAEVDAFVALRPRLRDQGAGPHRSRRDVARLGSIEEAVKR